MFPAKVAVFEEFSSFHLPPVSFLTHFGEEMNYLGKNLKQALDLVLEFLFAASKNFRTCTHYLKENKVASKYTC